MRYRGFRDRVGITLTELMVGVGIIALALIPIISSLISSMKTSKAGNMEVNAALIGSSIFEAILNNLEFDEVTDGMKLDPLAGVSDEDGNSSNNEIEYEGTKYKLKLTVNPIHNNSIDMAHRHIRLLFGRTKKEYAKKGMDAKTYIKNHWRYFKVIKLKLGNRLPDPSLKEIFLEIRWVDPKGLERVYNFYTRKARI
jgi:hypothetical protein